MLQPPVIFQIKITLIGVTPPIWRRLQVPSDLFLHDFHKVIQTSMGWENSHLHQFVKNGRTFGIADDEFEVSDRFMDYTSIRLIDILNKEKETIRYIYDFGDTWIHEITLEKQLKPSLNDYYPFCVDGERNCPPEDSGGPWAYMEMVRVFNSPTHPDRLEIMEWLDEDWNPESFNVEIVNEMLMEEDFGCLPLID